VNESPRRDREEWRALVKRLPREPGVYRFRGEGGEVLYVGKAKDLRVRVRSYFRAGTVLHGRVAEMLRQARDLDWVVCSSEAEALLLEDNFVKEARPPFNVRLRDDKSYPSIEVTLSEEWPRLRFYRGPRKPGNLYFGPYPNARAVRETLDLVGRIFPYRKCRGAKPGRSSGAPCLQYSIKRSLAPCDGRVDRETYLGVVAQATDFLRGRLGAVERQLEEEMERAAGERRYEVAAALRDRLAAVRQVRERQAIRVADETAFDVVGLSRREPGANVQLFRVREGNVVDRQSFFLENAAGRESDEVLEEFLLDYYWEGAAIPAEIIAPLSGDAAGLAQVLSERRGAQVDLRPARRGAKLRLLEMAAHNADLAAAEEAERLARREPERQAALARLGEALGLPRLPLRIEGYDISNLGEEDAVGAMVVFEGGRPRRSHYRRFAIRTVAGQDDFAMLAEVVARRFERQAHSQGEADDESFAATPDLIVVDGGKGQLAAVSGVLRERAVGVPAVALAKQQEEVFASAHGNALALAADDPAVLLLRRLRDEAHRFAITYHRRRRQAELHASPALASLPQVGPVRRRRLLQYFGSPERVLNASREELERVPGVPRKVAREVYAHLHKTG